MSFSVTPHRHNGLVARLVFVGLSLIVLGVATAVSTSRAITRAVRLPQ